MEVESTTYLTNQHRRRFRDRHRELEIEEAHSTRRRDDWLLKRKSSELNEGRAQTLRRLLTIAVVSALEMRDIKNATFEQVRSGKHNILSIDPDVLSARMYYRELC